MAKVEPVDYGYVRLRGLPFTCSELEIKEFFEGLEISRIKFTTGYDGRPNGEAFVELATRALQDEAVHFDRKNIKGRYIEVFIASPEEAQNVFKHGSEPLEGHVVRLRGLPWSCEESDIEAFFEGLKPAEIVIGKTGGPRGRASGEAFVKFSSGEEAQKALEYNKKHLGSRYLEVFPSSQVELNREKGILPPVPPERSGIRPLMSIETPAVEYPAYEDPYSAGYDEYGYGYTTPVTYGPVMGGEDPFSRIYMRGLPYEANASMIEQFFAPLQVYSVKLGIDSTNRSSGDAIATFANFQDAASGMGKNNQKMGKRYVELFTHRDVPQPMRRILWKDLTYRTTAPPKLDSLLANGGGKPDKLARSGGVPLGYRNERGAPRGQRGIGPRQPARQRDPWSSVSANTGWDDEPSYGARGAQSWQGYDPYNTGADRDREAYDQSDANADSWGGWGGSTDYYGYGYQ